jgi:hypothetical protein
MSSKKHGPGQKATDVSPDSKQRERYIAALKRERAGYVQSGKQDRVDAVDAELKRLGVGESKPRGRAQRPQQTADKAEGDKA